MLRSLVAATLLATCSAQTQFANHPLSVGSKIPSIDLDLGFPPSKVTTGTMPAAVLTALALGIASVQLAARRRQPLAAAGLSRCWKRFRFLTVAFHRLHMQVNIAERVAGKKIILVGLPGAFTPT